MAPLIRARYLSSTKSPVNNVYFMNKFRLEFNEATPRGVPGPVFKKTPEMPGITKKTRIGREETSNQSLGESIKQSINRSIHPKK